MIMLGESSLRKCLYSRNESSPSTVKARAANGSTRAPVLFFWRPVPELLGSLYPKILHMHWEVMRPQPAQYLIPLDSYAPLPQFPHTPGAGMDSCLSMLYHNNVA
jgi:hypothetical protein